MSLRVLLPVLLLAVPSALSMVVAATPGGTVPDREVREEEADRDPQPDGHDHREVEVVRAVLPPFLRHVRAVVGLSWLRSLGAGHAIPLREYRVGAVSAMLPGRGSFQS